VKLLIENSFDCTIFLLFNNVVLAIAVVQQYSFGPFLAFWQNACQREALIGRDAFIKF